MGHENGYDHQYLLHVDESVPRSGVSEFVVRSGVNELFPHSAQDGDGEFVFRWGASELSPHSVQDGDVLMCYSKLHWSKLDAEEFESGVGIVV